MDISRFLAIEQPSLMSTPFYEYFDLPFEGLSCCIWFCWWVSITLPPTRALKEPVSPSGSQWIVGVGGEEGVWDFSLTNGTLNLQQVVQECRVSWRWIIAVAVEWKWTDLTLLLCRFQPPSLLLTLRHPSVLGAIYILSIDSYSTLPDSFSGDWCIERA